MAKDRITQCIYYICAGKCEKGRGAEHKGYCQKCDQYRPCVRERHLNEEKGDIEKIRKKEQVW